MLANKPFLLILSLCSLWAMPAAAQNKVAPSPVAEWTWNAPIAQKNQAGLMLIHLEQQMLMLFVDGQLVGTSPVSTGRADYPTPVGDFTVLERDMDHRSNLYEDAPMPYMLRLTWSGVALHGGYVPGYPASHGCVRLPEAFAKKLYERTRLGTAVSVVRGPLASQGFDAAFLTLAAPDNITTDSTQLSYRLQPNTKTAGPLIIHMHLGTGRLEIIRQGREVARGDIARTGEVKGKYYLQYGRGSDGNLGWQNLMVLGDATGNANARIDMHPALLTALQKWISPGAVLIVSGQDQPE